MIITHTLDLKPFQADHPHLGLPDSYEILLDVDYVVEGKHIDFDVDKTPTNLAFEIHDAMRFRFPNGPLLADLINYFNNFYDYTLPELIRAEVEGQIIDAAEARMDAAREEG